MDEYKDGVVGAKSKNLAGLRGRLPDNINLPASVTLPFGCFEQVRAGSGPGRCRVPRVPSCLPTMPIRWRFPCYSSFPPHAFALPPQALELKENQDIKTKLKKHVDEVHKHSKHHADHTTSNGTGPSPAALLAECRKLAMQVVVPKQIRDDLAQAMKGAGARRPGF